MNHKNGFSLLELVIVISIIGLFLVLIFSAFSGMYKTQKIDQFSNNLIDLIRTEQVEVKTGKLVFLDGSDAGERYCREIVLDSNSEDREVLVNYYSVVDNVGGESICGFNDNDNVAIIKKDNFDKDVRYRVSSQNGGNVNKIMIRFYLPDGIYRIYDDNNVELSESILNVYLSGQELGTYSRKINLDTLIMSK